MSKVGQSTKPPQLPSNFASLLIEKEFELESELSLKALNDLVDLYRQAIEYYEHIQDSKFYDFQERLQKLIVRPEVMKIMQPGPRRRAQTQTTKKQNSERNRVFMAVELNKHMDSSPHKSQKFINRNTVKNKEVASKALKDFKFQDSSLADRLASRKQKMLSTSVDMPRWSSLNDSMSFELDLVKQIGEESDKSGGLPKMPTQNFEAKLEEILERHFEEKSAKIAEVKVKYESQLKNLEWEGNAKRSLADEIKDQMQREIKRVTEECDFKRRAELADFKSSMRFNI